MPRVFTDLALERDHLGSCCCVSGETAISRAVRKPVKRKWRKQPVGQQQLGRTKPALEKRTVEGRQIAVSVEQKALNELVNGMCRCYSEGQKCARRVFCDSRPLDLGVYRFPLGNTFFIFGGKYVSFRHSMHSLAGEPYQVLASCTGSQRLLDGLA